MHARWLRLLPIALAAALLPAMPAWADSCGAPRQTTYYSANRAARLIVTPHFPADPALRPYSGLRRGPSAPHMARAVLQRRAHSGRWRTSWQGQLRNRVMPVRASVPDSGRFFVTFDDWCASGTGPNVVVIFDEAGRVIRALSLPDLVSEDYALALPRTFSSIYWGGAAGFSPDGGRLILSVSAPGEELFQPRGDPVSIEVELASGRRIPPGGRAWDQALAEATRIRADQRAWAAQRLAFMTEPLLGPVDGDRNAWQGYLTEAYYRLYPGAVHPTAWPLDRRGAPRYADDRLFVGDILRRSRTSSQVAILLGGPDEEDLIGFLTATLAEIPPDAWRNFSIYVAVRDANWPRIVALFAPTGANVVQIDPTEPVPQLPGRLRTYVETGASGPLTPAESTQD